MQEGTLSDAGDKFECSHGNIFGRIEHLVSVGYLQYDDNLSHVIVYSEEFNERRNPTVCTVCVVLSHTLSQHAYVHMYV